VSIYEETDYKATLREKIREARSARKGLTMKRLADKIPVQYTYLSKALRDPKTHLNEDHLFALCRMLQMLPEEIDFVFLLRSFAIAQDPTRKAFIQNKINHFRRKRELRAEPREFHSTQLSEEMGYLFDPLCILVHVSLFIEEIAQNPRRLCGPLGVSPDQLAHILKKLHRINFIELDHNGNVARPLKDQIHYGPDHPLMRVHQALLRHFSAAQLLKTPEHQKHSIMTTFAAEPEVFKAIQKRFQVFLREVESQVIRSRAKHTFQLNFDLFQWL
jgi:hypothetical protein